MEDSTSQKSQTKPGGNTKNPRQTNQLYRWFVTLPAGECSASQLSQHLKGFTKKFTFQGEQGESGFQHWQIEVSLKEKMYFEQFKNMLGFEKAHIEPTKDYFKAKAYCSKDDTRIEGPYNEESVFFDTPVLIHEWQINLKNECLGKPDYRKIKWYVDYKGGAGKTDFCLNMYDTLKACIFNNGKFSDIAFALPENPKIVIFDLPRTLEERVNYTAIEACKNGLIFSGKYESSMKRFNKPHVIVMANFEPDYDALSKDRWDVIFLNKEEIENERD